MDPRLAAELELAALPHEELVHQLYRLGLRRDPEPAALEQAVARLTEGTLSRASLIRDLVTGKEFERVRLFDDAVAFAAWARAAGERPRELRAPPRSDERPIEIPWCLARYRGEPRVLDVGYAFAEPAYLAALLGLGAPRLVGVDLAEADVPGLKRVQADLRALPFEAGSFDVILCISTIEHVGAGKNHYGLDAALDDALRELRRVGGRTLVTVPCGEPGDHGWFVQDEPDGWRARFRNAGFLVLEDEVYELTRMAGARLRHSPRRGCSTGSAARAHRLSCARSCTRVPPRPSCATRPAGCAEMARNGREQVCIVRDVVIFKTWPLNSEIARFPGGTEFEPSTLSSSSPVPTRRGTGRFHPGSATPSPRT